MVWKIEQSKSLIFGMNVVMFHVRFTFIVYCMCVIKCCIFHFFLGYFLFTYVLSCNLFVLPLTEDMVSAICYAHSNVSYLFINICKH